MNYFAIPLIKRDANQPHVDKVIMAVSLIFNINPRTLIKKSRKRPLPEARFMCWYILRQRTTMSLDELAKIFNKKDHTSVKHGVDKMKDLLQTEPPMQHKLITINSRL